MWQRSESAVSHHLNRVVYQEIKPSTLLKEWDHWFDQNEPVADVQSTEQLVWLQYLQVLVNRAYVVGSFAHVIYQLDPRQPLVVSPTESYPLPKQIEQIITDLKRIQEDKYSPTFLALFRQFIQGKIEFLTLKLQTNNA